MALLVRLFLPIIMGGLAIAEYIYTPNLPGNLTTWVYVWFLAALLGLYIVLVIISSTTPQLRKTLRTHLAYKAPFYTLVWVLFMLYDLATVKLGILPLPYFPWVDQILRAALGDVRYLFSCIQNSLVLLGVGYACGLILGLLTGIACGYSKRVRYWIDPFMKLLGAIPSTTLIPLVLVIAASMFTGAVFIIGLGVWFSVTIATTTGIRTIDPSYYEAARTLGTNTQQLLLHIAIPAALPSIIQGMIQGMSSACTALLVAEMIGVESGLGWYITWQKSWAQYDKMYAALVVICLIFIIINALLKALSARMLRWQQDDQEA